MTRFPHVLAIAALAVSLAGCATIGKTATSITADPIASAATQVSIDVATGLVVQNGSKDPNVWAKRAAEIVSVVTQLQAIDSGSTVQLAALDAALQAKIASLHLGPADVLAVNALVTTAQGLILQQINGTVSSAGAVTMVGTLSPQQQVAVKTVLGWILAAASAYGTPVAVATTAVPLS